MESVTTYLEQRIQNVEKIQSEQSKEISELKTTIALITQQNSYIVTSVTKMESLLTVMSNEKTEGMKNNRKTIVNSVITAIATILTTAAIYVIGAAVIKLK